jgi:crotonobetainyl-CoA:carnitine CoA-transferase CaiB-like acyl-CoA transferase
MQNRGTERPPVQPPLTGIRVIDFTHYIAGPVCTKLLAQLGAEVIKIERPGVGDGSRRLGPFSGGVPHPEKSGLFLYLNTGKKSITLDLKNPAERRRLLALIEDADLLVESFAPRVMPSLGLGFATLHRAHPRLVYTSISNFGQWGPYRDLKATEITGFALGGLMYLIGYPDRPPLKFGAHPALYMAGLAGFCGSLAALLHAEATGHGQHVDVSIQEAVASSHFQALDQYDYLGTVLRRNYMMMSFPCADDFVGCAIQPHQWPRFVELVDIPELRQITGGSILDRQENSELIETLILPWMLRRTKTEIYHLGQEAGLPFSYVATIKDLLESPQYRARGFFTRIDHPLAGTLTYPGIPYRMPGVPPVERRAPLLGEHTTEVLPDPVGSGQWAAGSRHTASVRPSPPSPPPAAHRPLPLTGVRVLDLGIYQSAPYCGRLLGDAGAEVIKVESTRRPDPLRLQARGLYPGGDPGEHHWNRSAMVNDRNRSKLGITLDLTTEAGRSLFRRLVSISDVVLENFSTRVMGGFGLDYRALARINPGIVMISIGSQGRTGPEAHYVSFGTTLEQTGGLMGITGYPDTATGFSGVAYPDSLAGLLSAGLAMAALRRRARTGEGAYIDLSQRELTTAAIGEAVMECTITGRLPGPQGNRESHCAPQGAYRCRGDDRWVALSIINGGQWRALCAVLDRPDLADDPRFTSLAGRHQHHDLLDTAIEAWTCTRDRDAAARALQAAGIPAGAVLTAEELFKDPHLLARGFFEEVEDRQAGRHRYPGRPWRLDGTPLSTRRPAPALGEHNERILCDYLGLGDAALTELTRNCVIGIEPLPLLQGD